MTDREKLIELLYDLHIKKIPSMGEIADHILADGWTKTPCMVGDKVYVLMDMDGVTVEIIEGVVVYHEDDGCKSWKLELYLYDQFGKIIDVSYQDVYEEQFGKCVFLSYENAEKVLKGVE